MKNITTVLFSLLVSENFSSLHCYLNICKCFLRLFERLLNKTIKYGFSFSKFEDEEQFSAKTILKPRFCLFSAPCDGWVLHVYAITLTFFLATSVMTSEKKLS